MEDIALDILEKCKSESPILLMRDVDARTGNTNDFTLRNKHGLSNCLLGDNHPRTDRKNCDTLINQEGIRIIDLCKSFDLMILNGRTNGDYLGLSKLSNPVPVHDKNNIIQFYCPCKLTHQSPSTKMLCNPSSISYTGRDLVIIDTTTFYHCVLVTY